MHPLNFSAVIRLIGLSFLLIGCSQPESSLSVPPLLDDTIIEVPATDQLGAFESDVADLAFWVHPLEAFKSSVIAANGSAGLIMIDLEGNIMDTVAGTFENNITVSYFSPGHAIDAILLSYDSQMEKTRAFTITPETSKFRELTVTSPQGSTPQNLCIVRDGPSNLSLLSLKGSNIVSLEDIMLTGEEDITLSPAQTLKIPDVTACTSDDRQGLVYVAQTGGQILKLDLAAEQIVADPLLLLPEQDIAGLGVILQEEDNAQLAVMTLDRGPLVYSYNLVTNVLEGAFIIRDFDEIEAVRSVGAFAVGPDNYGTIYRSGAIAVVEGDDTRTLKLAPWSSVDSKLKLNLPAPVNSRTLNIAPPSGPILDFNLTTPKDLLQID